MGDLFGLIVIFGTAIAIPVSARDASFRVEVLVRLERARFRRRVALTVPVAAVLAVVVAMSAPSLDAWMGADAQRHWIVAVGAAALFGLSSLLVESRAGVRSVVTAVGRWFYL